MLTQVRLKFRLRRGCKQSSLIDQLIQQHRLFTRLMDETGRAPVAIDSDDLLEDPHRMVAAYCRAVSIEFLPEALSWEPGARDEVSWYEGGSWHESLRQSDGLKPQPSTEQVDIGESPALVKDRYDVVLPLYREMHRHRLLVDEGVGA